MTKIQQRPLQILGVAGSLACVGLFIHEPSFPTPDKLIIFLTFLFMSFSQATEMLKRLVPFVILLLSYESFRGVAHELNSHVDYNLAPHMDRLIFGSLPTATLQSWWWHGTVTWYDIALYIPYLLHFVLPIGLALLIWKTREKHYWRFITTYLVVSFAGFLTFLILPTAPPWLASQTGHIPPITRISSDVWYKLGIHDFPSLYNHLAPNPVASVPSLHAAWATLLVLFIWTLYGKRWGLLSCIYPIMIFLGTVYEGEHYGFDILVGIIYAVAGYLAAPWVLRQIISQSHRLRIWWSAPAKRLKPKPATKA